MLLVPKYGEKGLTQMLEKTALIIWGVSFSLEQYEESGLSC